VTTRGGRGGGGVAEDEVEDLGGDARLDPLDDGEIVFDSLGIIGPRHRVGNDMAAKMATT
jgi:hypothetical protein